MRQYIQLNRGVISIRGPDARPFLQGLVTVDVEKLTPEHPRYAALLSPQGKFLHDFFLLAEGNRILLDTDKHRQDELMTRLSRYKLRAQVEVSALEEMSVFALTELPASPAPSGTILIADPRFNALGWRLYGPQTACTEWLKAEGFTPADTAAYETHRLQLGVPDGSRDLIADRSFIMECGFEQLHGVDFDKGCYVGQELTARTKFRAVLRKQFYCVKAEGDLPAPSTKIMQGAKEAGELRSSQGNMGLAVLYNEAVASGEKLKCGNVFLNPSLPLWAEEKTTGAASASGV